CGPSFLMMAANFFVDGTAHAPAGGAWPLLWELNAARSGPPLEDLAFLGMRRAVGKSAHLDRPVATIHFDRQQPFGSARGAVAQRPDRRVPSDALCRVSRDAVPHGPRLGHEIGRGTQLNRHILPRLVRTLVDGTHDQSAIAAPGQSW